jgi:hypothetical protein
MSLPLAKTVASSCVRWRKYCRVPMLLGLNDLSNRADDYCEREHEGVGGRSEKRKK